MKIFIEKSDEDIVKIIDWGDISKPANTEMIDNIKGFDDMFELDARLKYDSEDISRWDELPDEQIPYYDLPDYVKANEGRTLIYCKSNGVVTHDNITFPGSIELTTDATDSDSDGVPDIPANGTSTCTITIKKKDYLGNYCTSAEDDDTILLSLTRGSLSALSVDLVNGVASVTLTSVTETVNTKIEARAELENMDSTNIEIQFTPVT